jgi:hypothetical protein
MVTHFVGFSGDEFERAQRAFGPPHFIHRFFDARCKSEIAPGDRVIFANFEESKARRGSWNDSAYL